MAVELCKFTLWLHVAHPKLPLSYLEPLIKCGNALVGVPLYGQVERAKAQIEAERKPLLASGDRKAAAKLQYVGWPESLPDEAFDPVAGDTKELARSMKARNKQQRGGQLTLRDEAVRVNLALLAAEYEKVKEVGEDTAEAVPAIASTRSPESTGSRNCWPTCGAPPSTGDWTQQMQTCRPRSG